VRERPGVEFASDLDDSGARSAGTPDGMANHGPG
jgi:hypothetical protein